MSYLSTLPLIYSYRRATTIQTTKHHDRKRHSILIVEDERIVAYDIRRSLEQLGYSIAGIVSTGNAAIKAAHDMHPDVVLMDISLTGEIDGIQAASVIGETANTPIIFVTGHSDTETMKLAGAKGNWGFVLKPVDFQELCYAIELAVSRARMHPE